MEDNEDEEWVEKTDQEYLADLAERLREVPAMYGVDGYDIDRLRDMATTK